MTEPDSRPTTYAMGAMCSKFRIEKLLGRGGMGEVYLAVDTFLDRRVALKVLPFKRTLDPSFQDRMQREAAAGARIDHPNVTKILDGGATDNHVFYIVMELLEGMRTLRALCYDTLLPFDSALVLSIQIAEGLSAVHAAGILHRDLKPENIAVLPGGFVKIIDFGLARVRSEWIRTSFDPSQGQQRMGTAHYMAPEQINNQKKDIGPRSDVYALACILFETFAGRHLFQRDEYEFPDQLAALYAHVHIAPERLDSAMIDPKKRIPPALADLIERCLAKDVRARPEADEVARGLRRIFEAFKAQPIPSSAQTARAVVPTDPLVSRAPSLHLELPPLRQVDDRASQALGALPPRGFAGVLATELMPEAARPTLASPQAYEAAPAQKLPKRTIRMSPVAPAAPPPPSLPTRSDAPRSIPTEVDAPRSIPTEADAPRAQRAALRQDELPNNTEPRMGLARYLWHHRISLGPGFALPFLLFAIGMWAIQPALHAIRSYPASAVGSAARALQPTAAPNGLPSDPVSPESSAQSFPSSPHSGQTSPARRPGSVNSQGH